MIKEKLDYLSSLGFAIEYSDNEMVIYVDDHYYTYEINFDMFEIGESRLAITDKSDLYSPCCGELVDRDMMRCPECQENC